MYEANVTMLLHGIKNKIQGPQSIIKNVEGFAKIYSYGTQDTFNFMTMELMGPSLSDMLQFCADKFSLKTTLMIADQLLRRFEYMHEMCFVHRDVKPDNFLMGLMEKTSILHVVDMGLAKRFYDSSIGEHIPYRDDK